MAGHTDFWVAIATISPIAIATNLLTIGRVMTRRDALSRQAHETGWSHWTAYLRPWHPLWVALNLAACLALIGLALQSLWSNSDAVAGWLAILLLMAMLVELCILALCSASIIDRTKHLPRKKPVVA